MALKVWRGSLSPKLEEEYHDMLRELARRKGVNQTECLKKIIEDANKENK